MEITKDKFIRLADQLENLTLIIKKRTEKRAPQVFEVEKAGMLSLPSLNATDQAIKLLSVIKTQSGKYFSGDAISMAMQK